MKFTAAVSALLLASANAFVPTTVPVYQVSYFTSGRLHIDYETTRRTVSIVFSVHSPPSRPSHYSSVSTVLVGSHHTVTNTIQ
jgi:hypothetical protein